MAIYNEIKVGDTIYIPSKNTTDVILKIIEEEYKHPHNDYQ